MINQLVEISWVLKCINSRSWICFGLLIFIISGGYPICDKHILYCCLVVYIGHVCISVQHGSLFLYLPSQKSEWPLYWLLDILHKLVRQPPTATTIHSFVKVCYKAREKGEKKTETVFVLGFQWPQRSTQ